MLQLDHPRITRSALDDTAGCQSCMKFSCICADSEIVSVSKTIRSFLNPTSYARNSVISFLLDRLAALSWDVLFSICRLGRPCQVLQRDNKPCPLSCRKRDELVGYLRVLFTGLLPYAKAWDIISAGLSCTSCYLSKNLSIMYENAANDAQPMHMPFGPALYASAPPAKHPAQRNSKLETTSSVTDPYICF